MSCSCGGSCGANEWARGASELEVLEKREEGGGGREGESEEL